MSLKVVLNKNDVLWLIEKCFDKDLSIEHKLLCLKHTAQFIETIADTTYKKITEENIRELIERVGE